MENNEKKKSNVGLIIVIIIIILLLLFAVWFFLLRDKGTTNNNNTSNNNSSEKTDKTDKKDEKTDNKTGYEYNYKDGVLTTIVDEEGNPKQTDFVIDGIIIVGNHHEYRDENATESVIETLVKEGYKKKGLNKDFYLDEWIELYIDTKYDKKASDVKIMITPHKTVEELEKMSLSQLEDLANENGGNVIEYQTPDTDNFKYVGNGLIVTQDYKEGKYDILFTYKGKLAYFINVNLTKEPTE